MDAAAVNELMQSFDAQRAFQKKQAENLRRDLQMRVR